MNTLFVAYSSVSNPVMESQGISYMRGLSAKGVRYTLLTFEPKETLGDSLNFMAKLDFPLKWEYLAYHRKLRFLATSYDIVAGILATMFILKRNKINLIHARGFIAAIIAFLPAKIMRVKLFFDTRGFIADKYVCGGLLDKENLGYKLMKRGEDVLIRGSDYLTVETRRHAQILRDSWDGLSSKMGVIPCCVDTAKFDYQLFPGRKDNLFDLVFLGKVGTWYLLEDMLDFFSLMSKDITNSRFTFITESEPPHIYSAAKKKGIEMAKIMVMEAERSAVPGLLSAAKAGIFFMNTYKQYGFSPIKFGEFLACGLPVVINSGFADCDEITLKEDVGVVINEFSKEEYERAIRKLQGLLSEGDDLKGRCRAAAKRHFSLDMGIDRYFDVYSGLLSDKERK